MLLPPGRPLTPRPRRRAVLQRVRGHTVARLVARGGGNPSEGECVVLVVTACVLGTLAVPAAGAKKTTGSFFRPRVCARALTHTLSVCLSLSLFVATKRAPAVCPRRLCPSLRPLATAFSFRQVHQGPAKHAAVPGRYRQHCPSVSSSSSSTTTTTTHIRYHYCTGLSVSWPMQLARDCRTEEDEPGS